MLCAGTTQTDETRGGQQADEAYTTAKTEEIFQSATDLVESEIHSRSCGLM